MRSIWLFLCRLWTFLYMRLGVYKFWSNVYRFFWEQPFRPIKLHVFPDLPALGKFLSASATKWRADSWKQLWDAVSYPQTAQAIFEGTYNPKYGCDCDEFAIFITCVLEKMSAVGTLEYALGLPVAEPKFFTVMWMDGWTPTGHNVCLVRVPDGRYAFMDYGMPSGHSTTIAGVAAAIVAAYAPKADLLGWAIAKSDLTPEAVHWGA